MLNDENGGFCGGSLYSVEVWNVAMYSLTMVMMMLKSSCLTVVWNYTHHLLVSHDDDDDDDGDVVFNGLLHIAYSSFLRQEDADDRFWNYTERRAETPTLCTFYNSDFLIYSSMGSFYIPCPIRGLKRLKLRVN